MVNRSKIGASLPGLMSSHGLRRSFFGGKTCPVCGELRTRTYYHHPFPMPAEMPKGHWLLSDCACIRQERSAGRLEQQNLLTRTRRPDPLPLGLQGHSFENFKVTPLNKKPYDDCRAFMLRFPHVPQGHGILLMGPSGTGKTHLACAIANGLKERHSVFFASLPILLEKMRTSNVDLDELLSADLLVLDDIGSERETAWTMERLLMIVDGRLINAKPTIFTSNYELADFDARLGMRAASRIISSNLHLFLKGPDWRMNRQGRRVY